MPKQQRTYDYPRPAVTVDIVLFTVAGAFQSLHLQVLLVKRGKEPFRERWALPGGFLREGEDLPEAVRRELKEETGLSNVNPELVAVVATPGRDPRGHVVTIVYTGLVPGDRPVEPSGDVREARWFNVDGPEALPPLAFDHPHLLQLALDRVRRRLEEEPACFELLPKTFTLSELQALVEAILGRPLDRRNFRRRVREQELLAEVTGVKRREERNRKISHRPAQLYRFADWFIAKRAKAL